MRAVARPPMPQIPLELSGLHSLTSRTQSFFKTPSLSLTTGLDSIPLPFIVEIGLHPQLEGMGLCDLEQLVCLSVQLSHGKLEQQ